MLKGSRRARWTGAKDTTYRLRESYVRWYALLCTEGISVHFSVNVTYEREVKEVDEVLHSMLMCFCVNVR